MEIIITLIFVLALMGGASVLVAKNLIYVCGPNEVLIFSGGQHKTFGYRVIRGGRGMRTTARRNRCGKFWSLQLAPVGG